MNVNGDEGCLDECSALSIIASKLAPTDLALFLEAFGEGVRHRRVHELGDIATYNAAISRTNVEEINE